MSWLWLVQAAVWPRRGKARPQLPSQCTSSVVKCQSAWSCQGSFLSNAHAKVECQTPNSLSTTAPCLKPPPRHVSNSIAPPDHQSRAPAWNEARSRRSHVLFSIHSVSFLFLCFIYPLYLYLSFHSIALYLSSCLLFHLLCIGWPCLLTVTLCCATTRRVLQCLGGTWFS
jgi:hypothetical protein